MFKQTWKDILRDPAKRIPMIIVIILPVLFAGIFLGAMWDPYGNTKDMEVAVVNNDKAVYLYDNKINIGKNLVENLKEKDDMTFVETTRDKAKKGLKSGKYFMVITIPKKFSHDAATVFDKDPQKMQLKYEINPGINFLGSKVSSTVADNITAAVNKETTRQYATAMITAMNNMEDGLENALQGSDNLENGVSNLKTGYDTLHSNTGNLANGVGQLKDGGSNIQKGVNNFGSGIDSLSSGVSSLSDGYSTLRSNTSNLISGVSNLKKGATNLQNGVERMISGVDTASENSKRLTAGVSSLNQGVSNLENGLDNFPSSDNVSQLTGGLSAIKASDGLTDQQKAVIDRAISSLQGYSNGVSNLRGGVSNLANGVNNLSTGAQNMQEGISNLKNGLSNLQSGTSNLVSGVNKLSEGTNKLQNGVKNMGNGVSNLKGGSQKLQDGYKKLDSNIGKLTTGIDNLSNGTKKLQSGVNNMGTGVDKLVTGTGKLQTNLKDGIKEADSRLGNVNAKTKEQISEPVTGTTSEVVKVNNMGNSMAAFLATVGIWLGAMVFCMMYPINGTPSEKPLSAFQTWSKNASVFIPMSIIWGGAIVPLMRISLDIEPQNWVATIGVGALTGIALVSLIYFLNIALGQKAMALILLLLSCQLASGGGIFPVAMMTGFYRVLNVFMPFTYSIEAFRSTLANGNSIAVPCAVLLSIAIVFNLLSILVHKKQNTKAQELQDSLSVEI